MTEHTPGPWTYSNRNFRGEEELYDLYICGNRHEAEEGDEVDGDGVDDEVTPCYVQTGIAIVKGNATSGGIEIANARLIAAVPDLLESCRAFYLWSTNTYPKINGVPAGDSDADLNSAISLAAAAIAKAESGGEKWQGDQ